MALDPATGQVREMLPRSVSRRPVSLSSDGRRALYRYGQSEADSMQGLVVTETGQPGGRLVASAVDSNGVPLGGLASLSPQGDKVLFERRADVTTGIFYADTLWVVESDGRGTRNVGSLAAISSAVWDPSGRFIAYSGMADSTTPALRIVEVASGIVRDAPLPLHPESSEVRVTVTDWSRDGRFIGFVARQSAWEYWVVQGLLEERH